MLKLTILISFLPLFATASDFETVPDSELSAISQVTEIISTQVRHQAEAGPLATRDAHAKAHGCVRATFSVNSSLPESARSTVFSPGAVYPAWVRFSNGSGKSQNDADGDGRGVAIKLMGIQGSKLESDERFTQDFLMINHPVFFVRNAADYVEFQQTVATNGSPVKFFFPGVNPLNWRLHEANIARAIQGTVVNDPLASPYWSMTPYLYKNAPAKFMVRPCTVNASETVDHSSPNFLREALARHLSQRAGCFEFFVQYQKDATSMPVEDPTIEWDETVSPFVKIASLDIPVQEFESERQMGFCENLSMNPWHSVPEHRPLGGINRTRRTVYQTISNLRHELNKAAKTEPKGGEVF